MTKLPAATWTTVPSRFTQAWGDTPFIGETIQGRPPAIVIRKIRRGEYQLIHHPSGALIIHTTTKDAARRGVRALLALPIDFTAPLAVVQKEVKIMERRYKSICRSIEWGTI